MRMNYRHAFHAGNHADVLKHLTVLALCDALTAKPAPVFALDTHAGRGLYALDSNSAQRTGEAQGGIGRLAAEAPADPLVQRYLQAVRACRNEHGAAAYPGSPWLLAHALREQDRIAACELHPEEAGQLKANFAREPRVAVHERDGYAAMKAMLPPRIGAVKFARGLVLEEPAISWFFGNYVQSRAEREDWRFAPLHAPDVDGVAPAWIGLAECDPLVDEGIAYADKLRLAGVQVDLDIYRGVTHEFIKMGRAIPEARKAHADAARALRLAFGME